MKELITDLEHICQELNESRHEIKVLKERIKQELYFRKNNLRMTGVTVSKVTDVESCLEFVLNLWC